MCEQEKSCQTCADWLKDCDEMPCMMCKGPMCGFPDWKPAPKKNGKPTIPIFGKLSDRN